VALLLAIETGTAIGSVALADGDRIVDAVWLPAARDHGQALAQAVKSLIGGRPEAIDGYAVSIGPGSFTGLRVGLSLIKGLCLAHPRPAVPVSTLALLAAAIRAQGDAAPDQPIAAILDARAGAVFARLEPAPAEDRWVAADRFAAEMAAVGEGVAIGDRVVEVPRWRWASLAPAVPLARHLAHLAAPIFAAGRGVDPQPLEPAYLQPAAAEQRRSVIDPTPSR
jgi:tRNA threonylcarbamoyladenosine biosynthesis protein TsaB